MNLRDINPAIADLVLFLRDGPKSDLEVIAGIPGFKNDTLGKARALELIEHSNQMIGLTSSGERFAATLNRLIKVL